MRRATSILLFVSTALTGCAGPSVAPVGIEHPANPDAPAAPPPARSNTLAPQNEASRPHVAAPAAAAGVVKYVCPMHPKVTSNAPGKCAICGMALKPAAAQPATQPAGAPDHDHGAHDHGGHK
jgi:hypothetical protein